MVLFPETKKVEHSRYTTSTAIVKIMIFLILLAFPFWIIIIYTMVKKTGGHACVSLRGWEYHLRFIQN